MANKKPVTITMDYELWKKLKIKTVKEGTNLSQAIEKLIRNHLHS